MQIAQLDRNGKYAERKGLSGEQDNVLLSSEPAHFRKVLFVLEPRHPSRKEKLAEYYIRLRSHLIPDSVVVFEYDPSSKKARFFEECCLTPKSRGQMYGHTTQ